MIVIPFKPKYSVVPNNNYFHLVDAKCVIAKKNLSSSDFVFNCLKHKSTQYVWEIRDCWYVAHGVYYYMLVAWSDQQQAKDCWMGVWLGNILTEETARRMLDRRWLSDALQPPCRYFLARHYVLSTGGFPVHRINTSLVGPLTFSWHTRLDTFCARSQANIKFVISFVKDNKMC